MPPTTNAAPTVGPAQRIWRRLLPGACPPSGALDLPSSNVDSPAPAGQSRQTRIAGPKARWPGFARGSTDDCLLTLAVAASAGCRQNRPAGSRTAGGPARRTQPARAAQAPRPPWVTTSSPGSSTGSSSMHWPHPGDGDSGCRFVSMGADSCHTSDHERAWICPDLVLPGRSALEPKAAVRPMTELIFRQPTVAQATIPAELAADAPTVVTAVLCAYCRAAIPADSFVYWSPAKRLLSASCPDCHRRVTVAAPMWRRWSAVGSSGLGTSAPANDHHDPRPHARPPPGPCSAACRSPRRGC